MKRVLLVDDDPIALKLYRDGLARQGFEVITANDGLTALRLMKADPPDIMVLDLMMPRLSGAEVLEFMRSNAGFNELPVIVLSNAYMDPLAQDAARFGARKGLLKVKCNPGFLANSIREVLEGTPATGTTDQLLAASADPKPSPTSIFSPPPKPVLPELRAAPAPPPEPVADPRQPARDELAQHSQTVGNGLIELFEAFVKATAELERKMRLENLYRKVHFITALAGMADYQDIAQMASATEALLFGIMDKPGEWSPSMHRTASYALECLQQLLAQPPESHPNNVKVPWVLVVDDDKLCTRMVVSALRHAQLQARGTESPEIALRWLQQKTYDLILMDIEMPGMDGLELCRRVRALPEYASTPVIYVTAHTDLETQTKTISSGGTDFIAKPIQPAELTVKVVMHLLKREAPGSAT